MRPRLPTGVLAGFLADRGGVQQGQDAGAPGGGANAAGVGGGDRRSGGGGDRAGCCGAVPALRLPPHGPMSMTSALNAATRWEQRCDVLRILTWRDAVNAIPQVIP